MSLENLFGLVQTVVMVIGVIFVVWQIKLASHHLAVAAGAYKAAAEQAKIAAQASSAVTLSNLVATSRDLQWRVLEDRSLHRLFHEKVPDDGLSIEQKLALVRGMLINHYAFAYEFHELDQLGGALWAAICADMHEFFKQPAAESRWEELKYSYSAEFREFVDKELLHRT